MKINDRKLGREPQDLVTSSKTRLRLLDDFQAPRNSGILCLTAPEEVAADKRVRLIRRSARRFESFVCPPANPEEQQLSVKRWRN
jgi:hypothetical protein